MDTADLYATSRQRLIDLAPALSAEQQAAPLAATPPWTVVDGYRHLTGACADVLDGQMAGAPGPAWTANQLAVRADRSLAEVVAEWAERGPQLDAQIAGAGPAMGFVALDVWTHEQDIRAAAGVGALHDDPLLPDLVGLALGTFAPYYAKKGGPPILVVVDGEEHPLGDGQPAATLTAGAYDFMRIAFGRRSEAQVAAAGWSGDSAAARAALPVFECPPHDLQD
jgi:uncharacterized protein (TIGR03083 family)